MIAYKTYFNIYINLLKWNIKFIPINFIFFSGLELTEIKIVFIRDNLGEFNNKRDWNKFE